jgi:FKBP-type peptidyl-prolyl cis-trans isomerase FkpA
MKRILYGVAAISLSLGLMAADKPAEKAANKSTVSKPEFKSEKDKASYAVGLNIGKSFKMRKMDVEIDQVAKGMKDAQSEGDLPFTDQEIQEIVTEYQMESIDRQAEPAAAPNKEKGKNFLTQNKGKEGVKTLTVELPNGKKYDLQYKALKEGTGPKPKIDDRVTVHYTGTLLDGTKFDSSLDRGQPAEFPLKGVIPGWTYGVQQMTVGSKYMFWIPSELAYRNQGRPPTIPEGSTLVFEIELLGINDAPQRPPGFPSQQPTIRPKPPGANPTQPANPSNKPK